MTAAFDAPIPTDAQRTSSGTSCNDSSVVRTMIGNIKTDNAMPPATAENEPVARTKNPLKKP
jgi:hypothetical protein